MYGFHHHVHINLATHYRRLKYFGRFIVTSAKGKGQKKRGKKSINCFYLVLLSTGTILSAVVGTCNMIVDTAPQPLTEYYYLQKTPHQQNYVCLLSSLVNIFAHRSFVINESWRSDIHQTNTVEACQRVKSNYSLIITTKVQMIKKGDTFSDSVCIYLVRCRK